jgi:hypothetical protein
MLIPSWISWRIAKQRKRAALRGRSAKAHPRGTRLRFEQLEGRAMLSNWTAASVSDLIADINAANNDGGSNTITLAPKTTFTVSRVDNTSDAANGLPVITSNLTIVGNGDTIQRKNGSPAFRLFDVASGASLTLENMTLQNGLVVISSISSYAGGGAIESFGSLVLSGVTVQDNVVQSANGANGTKASPDGQPGISAFGGGIDSVSGSLTLENGTVIQNNKAIGGNGGNANGKAYPGGGGNAYGGGVYIAGSTASVDSTTLFNNQASGGQGGNGWSVGWDGWYRMHGSNGSGLGGGISIGGGTVTLSNDTVASNTASSGGGIYIAAIWDMPPVCIDSFTVDNTIDNTDSSGLNGSTANIDGPYTAI